MSNSLTPEPGSERITRQSVRNTRRRQRGTDTGSTKTAPSRKRSKITEDTFLPPRHEEEEEEVNGTIEVASPNGAVQPVSPRRGRGRPRKTSTTTMEVVIPVREKKSSVKRPTRGDGATVLTQHERYSVKLLPSTPKELRREGVEYRGTLGAGHHALAVTRERAFIWDYTAHTTVSSPRIFDVPFNVKEADPLPFATLVATGAGAEAGLVIISATTGEVFYYESIERAASLGLFQERKSGVAGSVGPFYSGEAVVDLTSADHAGLIVTLSSGRIAQVTLRDTQGRARVSGQFLKATEQSSGGFLGGLKGLLGGSGWTKDVAAVYTRPLGTRGQMQVVSLTVRGEVQLWDLDWSGQSSFKGTIDCREMVFRELKNLESPELEGRAENFSIMDFAILQKPAVGNEVTTVAAEVPLDLAVLIRNGPLDHCQYALVEMSLAGAEVSVSRVLELEIYHGRSHATVPAKPHLVLPKAPHTAFVSFADAIVLAAMEESETNSPEAQLHASYVQPSPFEDCVYLKQGFSVLSACEEDGKAGQTSSIVFVKGAGLVRISAVDPNTIPRLPRTPVKSKIEQAIFHGALQDGNIIDFSRIDATSSYEEIEQAALEISGEILTSTTPFISTTPTSIEAHLAYKAHALNALVRHVRQGYPVLSHTAMWRLLWGAERVAAATQIWKTFEDHKAASSQKKRTATLVDELCAQVMQQLDPNLGDVDGTEDTVRNFFIHHLQHVEKLFPKTALFLKQLQPDTDISPQRKLQLLLQANELWNETLETVFAFRTENAAAYGILPEFIEDGVLIDVAEYVDLPEFWTSTEAMLKSVNTMCKISRDLASDEFDKIEENIPEVLQIGTQNPRLVELLCHIYLERINWVSSRPGEKNREKAEKLRGAYEQTRHDEFRSLAAIAQTEAGMKLAEKYKDMLTLTELVVSEIQFALEERAKSHDQRSQAINKYIVEVTARTSKYFDLFGDDWANAYFDFGFSGNHAGIMLQLAHENWPVALTKYLRADLSRAKLCWIDDLWTKKDFTHAQKCLDVVAKDQETKLWPKKIELSLSKLALLAAYEETEVGLTGGKSGGLASINVGPDTELEIVHIQETLRNHFLPQNTTFIDDQAELEVTMQSYGLKNQDLGALRQVLEAGVERVLAYTALPVDELIDVLTLMDSEIVDSDNEDQLQGQEFSLALKALNAAAPNMPQARFDLLLQLIWKRCYIYDDWVEINGAAQKTSGDEMESKLRKTVPWRTIYHAFDQDLLGPNSNVRLLPPSECLGAGCLPEELEYRWPEPDILHPILHDNKIQDEQLQGFVTDRRLDDWIDTCCESVKRELEDEAEENAQRLMHEREFQEAFGFDGTNGHDMNGHAKGPNGIEAGEEGEHRLSIEDAEGDEDVEMG